MVGVTYALLTALRAEAADVASTDDPNALEKIALDLDLVQPADLTRG